MADFLSRSALGGTIKVVDVSAQPDVANVVRNGRNVGAVTLNRDVAASLIAPDLLDTRITLQRVLTQSVPAGQRVTKGTVVDVVMVARALIPMNTFTGVHSGLAQASVEDMVESYLTNPQIKQIVERNDSFDALSDTDKTALVGFAAQQGLTVDETVPGQRGQDLFEGVRIASTFSV